MPASGKIVTIIGVSLYSTQKSYISELYCTEEENPVVVDDRCQLVRSLEISGPEDFTEKWEAVEEYVFGMTEIKVSAKVGATDETFDRTLDLLK